MLVQWGKDLPLCWCMGPPPTTTGGLPFCRSSGKALSSAPSIGAVAAGATRTTTPSSVSSRMWPRWWTPSGVCDLAGHSYGALCALEAALLTRNVRKLVLYDPGIEVAGEEIYPPEVIERLEALLEAGDRDAVVATTMREVAGLPPETVEYMRSQPAWQARWSSAIPRELRAVKAYGLDPERLADFGVPTLVLSGGDSPAALRKAGEAVDEAQANSRIVVMAGQGHAAMDTGTELFTTEVLRFVEDP